MCRVGGRHELLTVLPSAAMPTCATDASPELGFCSEAGLGVPPSPRSRLGRHAAGGVRLRPLSHPDQLQHPRRHRLRFCGLVSAQAGGEGGQHAGFSDLRSLAFVCCAVLRSARDRCPAVCPGRSQFLEPGNWWAGENGDLLYKTVR